MISKPLLSIIIPTYNKRNTLRKVLEALFRQNPSTPPFEVLIIDDGSHDKTGEMVGQLKRQSPVPLRYEWQSNQGVSAARNRAILMAQGDYSLLLGDDIIATPDLLCRHLSFHENHFSNKNVVIGLVTWPPHIKVSPFMQWLDQSGYQFAYNRIMDRREVNFMYFYTCNASLRTDTLRRHPFREEIRYCYEDIELGFRLQERGYRFLFNPDAMGYHEHSRDLKNYEARQLGAGKSLWRAFQLNPGLSEWIHPPHVNISRAIRSFLRGLVFPLITPLGARRMQEKYWRGRLNQAEALGFRAAVLEARRNGEHSFTGRLK